MEQELGADDINPYLVAISFRNQGNLPIILPDPR